MRKNIYFSERLDQDLIQYMEENNFYTDFSQNIKKLMRDGITFRKKGIIDVENKNVLQNSVLRNKIQVINTTTQDFSSVDFSDITPTKKVVDLSELEERLNDL